MIEIGWELILTIGGIIVTVLLFFNKMSTDLKRLEEKIVETRSSLSEEHQRHDDHLQKELLAMMRALERHISSEEIEGALQSKSREDITEMSKTLNDIKCKLKD